MSQPSNDSTSTSLIVRVKKCDDAAWERLATLYTPIVAAWAKRAGLQENDTADVVQEVFQAVARNIGQFERREDLPRFRGWLWGITRHKLLDHFRRNNSQPTGVGGIHSQWQMEQIPEQAPDDDSSNDFFRPGSLAYRALSLIQTDFKEPTWQAFWRITIEGHAAADVAAELGMSLPAVYTAKSRVLAHLRRELDGLD